MMEVALCRGDGTRCETCGAPRINARQLCGTWRAGFGDRVASALSAVGITKARAQAVAQAVGIEDCGCAERQQRLNELGRLVGIGVDPSEKPGDSAVDR